MDLKKKDVAELLTVSLDTIDRLIIAGKIPYYTLAGEHRFSRPEIENWMMETLSLQKDRLPFGEGSGDVAPWQQFGLYRAIHKGDVLVDMASQDKEEIIRSTMRVVADKLSLDDDMVSEMLLDREKLMPTALTHGIGIPHTREFLLGGLFDAVIVVYLQNPIDWGAFDGEKVHTLFFVFACDDKRHLNLLAKIAHLCSREEEILALRQQPSKEVLLDHIKEWETKVHSVRSLASV